MFRSTFGQYEGNLALRILNFVERSKVAEKAQLTQNQLFEEAEKLERE
jgi:hypothetical protein